MNKYGASNEVYIHREVLFHSVEGRELELITLSSYKGITTENEEMIEGKGLLPFTNTNDSRPYKFKGKKTIFITSRVHPGETPASFVLTGIFKFLLSPN